MRHGAVGYAVYFHCLELIAGDISDKNITFELEHDAEVIADNLKITGTSDKAGVDIVNEIMRFMIELQLFEASGHRITCMKMFKRMDSSMTSNARMRDLILKVRGANSGNIYIIKSEYGYKIGKTKNYKSRMETFAVKLPFDTEECRVYEVDDYHMVEADIHKRYAHKSSNGEWFSLSHEDILDIDRDIDLLGGKVMIYHDKSCKKRLEVDKKIDKSKSVANATHPTLFVPMNQNRYDGLVTQYGKHIVDEAIQDRLDWEAAHGKPASKCYAAAAANWLKKAKEFGKLPEPNDGLKPFKAAVR